MAARMTFSKNAEGTFDVKLSGGSPWGFTLQGGSEFHSKLCVSKLTPGGKADTSDALALGDEIIAINGIECCSRAEAIELVRCSRQKLRITIRRSGGLPMNNNIVPQHNGPPNDVSGPIPNLYKTALEINSSDFYSTYNVDPERYSKVIESQPMMQRTVYDSTENLSASHEDLLASYRDSGDENLSDTTSGQQYRTLGSSLEMANGRTSPESHGLRHAGSANKINGRCFHQSMESIPENDGDTRLRTWSLRPLKRGVSLPEGQHWHYNHSRTYTSPARIQKVKIRSKNISGPDHMPSGAAGERISPTGHAIPPLRSKSTSPPKQDRQGHPPDWVENWLRHEPTSPTGNLSVAAACAKFEQGGDRPVHVAREEKVKPREHVQDNYLNPQLGQGIPRSKSFTGAPSYGMKVTTASVRGRRSVQEEPVTTPPSRYSSSNLLRTSPHVLEPRHASSSSLPVDMSVPDLAQFANPSHDVVQLRLYRDAAPRPFMGGSTSSLDLMGVTDTSPGSFNLSRRQGPAPPPRHSTSKLLSSFRMKSRRIPPHVLASDVATAVIPTSPKSTSPRQDSARNLEVPRHSASKSWPTEHVVKGKQSDNRQSWHAEPPAGGITTTARREANLSGSSTSSEGNLERKNSKSGLRYSSSVVIRSMRSSSSSSSEDRTAPTVYRSSSVQGALKDAESEPSRIEDTKILLRLMQDSESNDAATVKSRMAAFQPKQDLGPESEMRSVSQVLHTERGAKTRASASHRSFDDSLLTVMHRSTASDATEKNSRRPLVELGPTSKEPTSHGRGIRVTPLVRYPNGPEPLRGSEVSRVAVVSPTRSGRKPDVKPEKAPVVEVVQREEKAIDVENVFQKMDQEIVISRKEEAYISERPAIAGKNDVPLPLKVGDDEVFLEDDDPLPPPPLEVDLAECSQDNLPLPSPPEEVLRDTRPRRKDSPCSKYGIEGREDAERDMAGKTLDGELLNGKFERGGAENELAGLEVEHARSCALNEPVEVLQANVDFVSPEPQVHKERLDKASPPPPLVLTSTPTSDQCTDTDGNVDNSTSPMNTGSTLSTPSGSRPNSMLSPKLEALDKEKADLVGSMEKKISDLRSQMQEIDWEIKANEELGEKVTKVVEKKATSTSEFSKYQLFTGELNKIIGLLLSLTQRMHRYEMMLQDLDMSEEGDRLRRDVLLEKIDKVKMQYEEACKIKEVNDKRGEVVSKFLENYLDEEEFADFQYYIDMKTQLALMHAEIRDKVKMGEERLNALTNAAIDWSILSLGS